MSSRKRYLCLHGHFYQPPRECPWTGKLERQPSASPFHDWNDRINHECYAANARARIGNGTVVQQLVNNYGSISFNFGPTLLSWMVENAPETLTAVIEADRLSQERLAGHGNAVAQVFNHMIMPLASDRDKRTQVIWGKSAFQHYFGRDPEGMHLAETAADTASLEALAAQGIKFTILAPRQAKQWRKLGDTKWESGGVDPSRAYLCRLPSGNSITLFFYDGPISQAIAFERLLNKGEGLLGRLMSGFNEGRQHDELVHVAVDGETIGHHHRYGEMCLAWVIESLHTNPGVELINYAQFMNLHPAQYEAQIHENSSWSCAHGVERWRSDCGCNAGSAGWNQQWRGPVRKALDNLRGKLDSLFEEKGRLYFSNPWVARDAYISVLLNKDASSAFVETYCKSGLNQTEVEQALRLMEMQRFGMLMYTSCAWFFDEISGLEPTQNLRYAARALQLAGFFTDEDLEAALMRDLESAPSNLAQFKNGRGVWEQIIRKEALVKEVEVLASSSLATLPELARLEKRFNDAKTVGAGLDVLTVQDRVLNAYARLQAKEEISPELKAAYVKLTQALGLAEKLLGWRDAGVNDDYLKTGRRFRFSRIIRNIWSWKRTPTWRLRQ